MGKIQGINTTPGANDEVASYSYAQNTVTSFQSVKTGNVLIYAGDIAPSGYLICDGSAVSRSTYDVLFNVIGTKYGAGNGSTTFNIPNLKSKMPVGVKTDGTATSLGATGGSFNHTHSISEHTHTQSHSHTANHYHAIEHYHSINHGHTIDSHSHDHNHSHITPAHHHNFYAGETYDDATHSHTYTLSNASSSGSHQIRGGDGSNSGNSTRFWTHRMLTVSTSTSGQAGTGSAGDSDSWSSGPYDAYGNVRTNTDAPTIYSASTLDYVGNTNSTSNNSSTASISSSTNSDSTGGLTSSVNVLAANVPFLAVNFIIKT